MRKTFIIIFLTLVIPKLCSAQTYLPDTIRVNRTSTTYLIFPSNVALVDISPEYLVKIESGNIVFVRPRTSSARATPLLVRTSDSTYLGYLSIANGTPVAFVEISKMQQPAGRAHQVAESPAQQELSALPKQGELLLASLNPTAVITPIGDQQVYEDESTNAIGDGLKIRMDSLLSGPSRDYDQERNSGIVVKLTHLLHDSTNTYVQLTIANKTAMPYLLDQVSFWYQNQARKRKGVYLDGETYPMEPILETIPDRVEADQKVQLRFVLPQFAPQSKSHFVINVREKSGTRNVTLTLPMKTVLYARAQPTGARSREVKEQKKHDRFSNLTWFWNDWKKKKA